MKVSKLMLQQDSVRRCSNVLLTLNMYLPTWDTINLYYITLQLQNLIQIILVFVTLILIHIITLLRRWLVLDQSVGASRLYVC